MGKSKHGRIDGQFVYMLYATLDSPAYRAISHGAKALYLSLKRRVSRGRDTAYISYRTAEKELAASRSGQMVRPSQKSCGVPSSARPVSIGHLGVVPKPQRASEVQGPPFRPPG